jgi:hypothetical protein
MSSHKKNHQSPVQENKTKHRRHRGEERKSCEKKKHEKSHEKKKHEHKTRKSHSHSHSHSSSSDDDEEEFEELYCKVREMLLLDKQLMIAGSNSYYDGFSTQERVLQSNGVCPYDFTSIKNNADYPYTNAPVFVREDGVYNISFSANTAQSTQFTLFINGIPQDLNISGNNAGSGQSVCNFVVALKKNDNVVVRNYKSETTSLNILYKVGGTQENCNINIAVYKFSTLNEYKWDKNNKCEFTRKEKCLFKKMEQKLLYDPCLQMKGFNVHGSFTNFTSQTVALEGPVLFKNGNNINGMTPMDGTGTYSQVRIDEDGIYRVEFLCTTDTSAQLAIFVNGVLNDGSIFGSNKGAGQIMARHLLPLNKGDFLSVNNHTSGGNITLSQDAGGILPGLSALLMIVKLCPLEKCLPCTKKENKECVEKLYCNFKKYLSMNKHLQLTGSDAFVVCLSSTPQIIQVGEKLNWSTIELVRNVKFIQGTTDVIIEQSGDYEVRGDIICDRPSQFTLFVNNVEVSNTTTGRDSGANRNIIRQILTLNKGDVVDIRNWKSNLGSVSTTQNSGGNYVDMSISLSLIKLSNLCEKYHKFK